MTDLSASDMVHNGAIYRRCPDPSFWTGKSVLITGHTGFKGGWLSLWLHSLGAKVSGLSLNPDSEPNFFSVARIADILTSDIRADVCDEELVKEVISDIQPDILFHMAAQPLVRESYRDPIGTFRTNALGTAHVLEAIREVPSIRVAVMITTDKVYDNREWPHPYRERDRLGGKDPYSASKACAELIIDCYRRSFFAGSHVSISSTRAGNVIGGGDWSVDRLIPDAVRAFKKDKPLVIRSPGAVRPWQHVLDALAGYLILAELSWSEPTKYAQAWNFAPGGEGECTVGYLAEQISRLWGENGEIIIAPSPDDPPEATLLRLDPSKSRMYLGWSSVWSLEDTLEKTVSWYKAWIKGEDMRQYSLGQIQEHQRGFR